MLEPQSRSWKKTVPQKLKSHQSLSVKQDVHLNRHIASVLEEIKPFKCTTCGANFAEKQALNIHTTSVHEKKKPFKCNV